ncbi:putative RNA polymerase II subunit B1 CTD phosphatase RPAP2 homolog isoform X1 [Cynara cardunculus var. scolymus]|uniref:putative RNA polymerase II subunit B1 CTD phosphatase RPAP2 homolog isoform X1 n=1 Tax=Cynara cardunculus var. scolymus TaxID=59895 RepID=UPI000D62A6F5|nr:putative RNA polymerase II subunit B1 CTD phosphatase RPAP2 homolog isoform X1 [Cynara cardunculus var. scolymus]
MSKTSSSSSPIAVKDVIHKLQLCLLEGIKSETHLLVAGSLLSKSDYHDVVTERSIAKMCGYPLCPNSLPSPSSSMPPKKGRYHISLKEHKVYDLVETHMYCSTKCVVDSRAYAESLQHERSLDLDTAKLDKVVRLFDGLTLKAEEVLGENGDFGMGNLSIKEKEEGSVGGGIVSMEEWIGPSNAIEGYVPQHDRSAKNRTGSKLKDSKHKREEKSIFDEMNFMSTIITQDNGYSISKEPSGQTKKTAGAMSKDSRKKMNHKGTDDGLTASADSSCNAQNVPETNLNKLSYVPSSACQNVVDVNVTESVKARICGKEAQPSSSGLKSSLKSSGALRTNHSVTWADEKTDGAHNRTLCEFNGIENEKETSKGFGMIDKSIDDDDDDDNVLRFASAEACAVALSQAADAVASGESDVCDAVSEAGLLILPPPLDDNEITSEEIEGAATDPEPARLKWPIRTGIVESDFFDSGDSWFDSPPEEFVVDLSPFATMFMSLFAWISSSTLAYLYGRDDSFHEEYASINGREYPRKIVLTDGRSSEIKQTLAGCLSRALPGLVHDLRLRTPVSTIEYGMGCLLDTMSFLDPLPSLRMKQWQVFVLLFAEALSVSRIPAIAPHLTDRRFFQKVFDDAQISMEEYEVLKDLMLPLGRVSQFATQSGG